jgi:hypothetical protein
MPPLAPRLAAAILCLLLAPGCVLLPTLGGAPPPLEPPPGTPPAGAEAFEDIRGVTHCHSYLSHDSEGSVDRIATAAREAGVRFVAMTDHYTPRAVREGFRGVRKGVLFFVGLEASRDKGSVLAIGLGEPLPPEVVVSTQRAGDVAAGAATAAETASPAGPAELEPALASLTTTAEITGPASPLPERDAGPRTRPLPLAAEHFADLGPFLAGGLGPTEQAIVRIDRVHALSFIGHAEAFHRWDVRGFSGLEVYNLHADALDESWPKVAAAALFLPPGAFFDALVDRPAAVLARWDELGRKRRVPGIGGCDAHENVRLFGPLGGRVGTYGECFRVVTTHVLARDASPPSILEALAAGRAYIAFEIHGDATGFSFDLVDARRARLAGMGEEVRFRRGARLLARAPGRARLVLLRDGELVAEATGGLLETAAPAPGVYRVEAYLDGRLFVLSNPIYLR